MSKKEINSPRLKFKSTSKMKEEYGENWMRIGPSVNSSMLKFFEKEYVLPEKESNVINLYNIILPESSYFSLNLESESWSYSGMYFEFVDKEFNDEVVKKKKYVANLYSTISIKKEEGNSNKHVTQLRVSKQGGYSRNIDLYHSPTGNCQFFSISTIDSLLGMNFTKAEIYHTFFTIFNIYGNKNSMLVDVTSVVFENLKNLFSDFVFTKKYTSTRGSSMVMGLLKRNEVVNNYYEEIVKNTQ